MNITSRRLLVAAGLAITLLTLCDGGAATQERKSIPPKDRDNPLSKLISGYYFSSLETRALQDDDFDNPGFRWVQQGEGLWMKVDGGAQKACSSCHGSANETMRGKVVVYPRFDEAAGKVINLEQQINRCREGKMRATPWAYGSEELLAMTAYLRVQSRGIQVNVRTDGPAKPTFDTGRQLYNSRMGQLGMSCALCHNQHYGQSLRGTLISQGHSNGFPTYEVEGKKFISLDERLRRLFRPDAGGTLRRPGPPNT